MNRIHRWLCRSARWQKMLEQQVMPWVLSRVDLGPNVLEIGPGPGLTTDLLRSKVERLTAVEIDPDLASSLAVRMHGTNVAAIRGDGAALPFEDGGFSGAVCFTMLHHVPSAALQDRLFKEARRVLEPGGTFAGVDSLQSFRMRVLHIGDILVPVDPRTLGSRLEAAGFQDVVIETTADAVKFRARRPAAG
jgi:SAM-dependent methyltransferase